MTGAYERRLLEHVPDGSEGTSSPAPAQRRRLSIDARAQTVFLDALRAGWSVSHAAAHAGRNRRKFYELAKRDPDFKRRWQEALDEGTDVLEDLLTKTALEGWEETERNGAGEVVRTRTRWTPQTLITALKGRRPEKYSEGVKVSVSAFPVEQEKRTMVVDLREIAAILAEANVPISVGEAVDGEAVEVPELEAGDST